jgi:hypothetical protein
MARRPQAPPCSVSERRGGSCVGHVAGQHIAPNSVAVPRREARARSRDGQTDPAPGDGSGRRSPQRTPILDQHCERLHRARENEPGHERPNPVLSVVAARRSLTTRRRGANGYAVARLREELRGSQEPLKALVESVLGHFEGLRTPRATRPRPWALASRRQTKCSAHATAVGSRSSCGSEDLRFTEQELPHCPQLSASELRSTQTPAQHASVRAQPHNLNRLPLLRGQRRRRPHLRRRLTNQTPALLNLRLSCRPLGQRPRTNQRTAQ